MYGRFMEDVPCPICPLSLPKPEPGEPKSGTSTANRVAGNARLARQRMIIMLPSAPDARQKTLILSVSM
jgi:hypothetical protein